MIKRKKVMRSLRRNETKKRRKSQGEKNNKPRVWRRR